MRIKMEIKMMSEPLDVRFILILTKYSSYKNFIGIEHEQEKNDGLVPCVSSSFRLQELKADKLQADSFAVAQCTGGEF